MDKPFEKKVTGVLVPLTRRTHELFKHKCYSEGYSVTEVLQILVDQYTNDKLIIKD